MEKVPQKIGVVLKSKISNANELIQGSLSWLEKQGCKLVIDKEAQLLCQKFPQAKHLPKEDIPGTCDMVLVFGGDGTFLSIARQMVEHSIPILGINSGQLGFLTEVSVKEARHALENVLSDNYKVQKRMMLSAAIWRNGKEVLARPALNDAVITNTQVARTVDLSVKIDDVSVASIKADGLIVSTPTGSTAYSLAAGGPIIHPTVSALTIAAICPHSITTRPIVVPDTSVIEVNLEKKDITAVLTLDGQSSYDLKPEDTLIIKKYTKHVLKTVRGTNRDFFELLRKKFKLGARGES